MIVVAKRNGRAVAMWQNIDAVRSHGKSTRLVSSFKTKRWFDNPAFESAEEWVEQDEWINRSGVSLNLFDDALEAEAYRFAQGQADDLR